MRPHGFPPALRILRGSEFTAVMRRGASAGDDVIVVHALAREGGPGLPPRLGLAVGRDAGGAARRNRLRRRLREAFRQHRHALPPATDLVVRARGPASCDATLEVLVASLVRLSGEAARRARRKAAAVPPEPPPAP